MIVSRRPAVQDVTMTPVRRSFVLPTKNVVRRNTNRPVYKLLVTMVSFVTPPRTMTLRTIVNRLVNLVDVKTTIVKGKFVRSVPNVVIKDRSSENGIPPASH